MKGNIYKSKFTDKIYLVETVNHTQGWVNLVCMYFPYAKATVSKQSLKRFYAPITKEKQ